MKIYIMGSTGAGKTTLAKILSRIYNIKYYELDKIVYDQKHLEVHRKDEEIEKNFETIINNDSWIIEDVGRNRFIKGREMADKIYYIKIPSVMIYKQMIFRWIKQRRGLEDYNTYPTIKNLFKSLKDVHEYKKIENKILESLNIYKEKLVILGKNELDRLIKKSMVI